MTDATQGFDSAKAQAEEWVHILRMQEETRKYVEERNKFIAEAGKLNAEAVNLAAESAKLSRDRDLAPWQLAFGGMAAGAALVGATAALVKIFG
jgi:hypothetical protein